MTKPDPLLGHVPDRAANACPPDLLTIAETASYLRISTRTVSKEIANGALRASLVGKQYRISRRALENYLIAGKKG